MYRRFLVLLVIALAACGTEHAAEDPALGPSLELIAGDAVIDPSGRSDFLLVFDMLEVGGSARRLIQLRNGGDRAARITISAIEGPFGIEELSTLAPAGEGAVRVNFHPEEAGTAEGYFVLFDGKRSYSVRLLGQAFAPRTCEPRFATSLDLGTTEVGSPITGTLQIFNDGLLPCSVEVDPPTLPTFSVSAPATVAPGASGEVQITFAPRASGAASGQLRIRVGTRVGSIDLQADALASCLALPERVEVEGLTCGDAWGTVEIANRCDREARLGRIRIEGPLSWRIFQEASAIAAGGAGRIDLRFRPDRPGTHEAILHIERAGHPDDTVLLEGNATVGVPREDRFRVPTRPKTDLLVVVDDGPGMVPYRQRLVALLDSFSAEFGRRDLHLGLTTTSLVASPSCAGSGADGRLLPLNGIQPRFVSSESEGSLATRIPAAFCSAAPNQGIEAAWRALTTLADTAEDDAHPEIGDGNAGFLRPDVPLSLLFVSAGDDTSAEPVATWSGRFSSLGDSVRVFAVVAPPGGCDEATEGARYQDLASATGGSARSLCDASWIEEVMDDPPLPQSRFYLTRLPLDLDGNASISGQEGEIAVQIDGVTIKPTGAHGAPIWWYEPQYNSVAFAEDALPPEGSEVVIAYAPACMVL